MSAHNLPDLPPSFELYQWGVMRLHVVAVAEPLSHMVRANKDEAKWITAVCSRQRARAEMTAHSSKSGIGNRHWFIIPFWCQFYKKWFKIFSEILSSHLRYRVGKKGWYEVAWFHILPGWTNIAQKIHFWDRNSRDVKIELFFAAKGSP